MASEADRNKDIKLDSSSDRLQELNRIRQLARLSKNPPRANRTIQSDIANGVSASTAIQNNYETLRSNEVSEQDFDIKKADKALTDILKKALDDDSSQPPKEQETKKEQDLDNSASYSEDQTEESTSDEPSVSDAETFATSTYNCGNNLVLDKRAKIFRTHDHVLWLLWVDALLGSTVNTFTITDESGAAQATTEQISDEESVLFFTKAYSDSLVLPIDIGGAVTNSVYWCVYYDNTVNQYRPLKGVKYFDFWFDTLGQAIDLIFWANILVDDLNAAVSSSQLHALQDLYPNSLQPSLNENKEVNDQAQRCLFYTKGVLRTVHTKRKKALQPFDMFLFSRPVLLLNPGRLTQGSKADVVLDQIPNLNNFVEFTG